MSGNASSPAVLVVEDDPRLAALYAEWLAPEYRVEAAGTGEEALEAMAETPRDVVLLDRRLPDVSGGTVLSVLRDRGHQQPVAMVTGVSPGTDILDMRFDEYLTKPVDETQLREAVERLLDARSWFDLRRELSSKKIKRNVLRLEHRHARLEEDASYRRLEREIERLERRLGDREGRSPVGRRTQEQEQESGRDQQLLVPGAPQASSRGQASGPRGADRTTGV